MSNTFSFDDIYEPKGTGFVEVPINEEGGTLAIPFTKPGMIQVSELAVLFIKSYLPKDIDIEDLDQMSEEEKFQLAAQSIPTATTDDSEEDMINIGVQIYTKLFFSEGNTQLIEKLVMDCFGLEARRLKNPVLMALLAALVEYLINSTTLKDN